MTVAVLHSVGCGSECDRLILVQLCTLGRWSLPTYLDLADPGSGAGECPLPFKSVHESREDVRKG